MAFPANWLQLWVGLPGMVPRLNPRTLCWFSCDVPFPNNPIFYPALFTAIDNWCFNSLFLLNTSEISLDQFRWTSYCQTTGPILYQSQSTGTRIQSTQGLPVRKCVVVQRLTGGLSRRQRGRFYLPVVNRAFVDHDHLNDAGLAYYQNVVSQMNNIFVAGPTTFTPGFVSYADATIVPIQQFQVIRPLGVVMRRTRQDRGPFNTPKPPPP